MLYIEPGSSTNRRVILAVTLPIGTGTYKCFDVHPYKAMNILIAITGIVLVAVIGVTICVTVYKKQRKRVEGLYMSSTLPLICMAASKHMLSQIVFCCTELS